MGLISVLSTQLWHHMYLGGGLCDLPDTTPNPKVDRPAGLTV
jgi:asparagine synthase (glutamine-hydrolysing)